MVGIFMFLLYFEFVEGVFVVNDDGVGKLVVFW